MTWSEEIIAFCFRHNKQPSDYLTQSKNVKWNGKNKLSNQNLQNLIRTEKDIIVGSLKIDFATPTSKLKSSDSYEHGKRVFSLKFANELNYLCK